ncbi:MAG: DUF1549 domain-containing protein [Pedosphaera sp.]|nr:DUF1549 domain-containing protein [Pedosphaera sp.]
MSTLRDIPVGQPKIPQLPVDAARRAKARFVHRLVNPFSQTCSVALAALLALAARATFATPGQSFEDAKKHWAYQPVHSPAAPKVKNARRVQSPVDAFLLAKLEEKKLSFAPPADKRTLLRRVYFDLIGLPPTMEELQAFERDHSREAFAKVVDRLLASPRYGERWGRHWLDVARYADTKDQVLAYGKDALRPFAYTYRDYVIRAFNEDLPFDQFIQDQLAADQVEPKVPAWRLTALGFLTLGRLFDTNPHDQIDDQIDTTTRGFLGLTVACARCHDHKYDAILQKDYYALYGVFASTERPYDLPLIEDPKQVAGGVEFEEKLAAARKELEQHIEADFGKLTEVFRQRIGDYLVRAATTEPDITETTQFGLSLIPEDFRPTLMLRTRRFLQQRAQPGDHVFGPWAELMALPEEKFFADAAAPLAAKQQNAASSFNPLVLEALAKSALTNKAAVARAYGNLLHDIYEESKKPAAGSPGLSADQRELLELVTGRESPIWFPLRDTPNHMSRVEKDRYGGLVSNLDKLAANATNAPAARAMVVADLSELYEPHIFKRGNPSRLGDAVPRAFLTVLSGGQPVPFAHGSGRLELARAISSTANPLTARVFVNRVWMHHFGEPLANSTTDFGARNEPPANIALLDWLAAEFIRSGWSVKHLHHVMVLSSAYQQGGSIQSSVFSGKSRATEHRTLNTENFPLSHYPRRRLDLEAMRDSLLSVSGQLDLTVGGRSVEGASDPLNHRRTVYGLVDRQNLPPFYRAFDFANPDQCIERRPRTSVPQQALFAMNSPFVLEQARALVAREEIAGAKQPAQRVDALFRRVLDRKPTKMEVASALRFVTAASADEQPKDSLSPWEQFAQVLLASNEAAFID